MSTIEAQYRHYQPDYTGMNVKEFPFCIMENHEAIQEEFKLDFITCENENRKKLPVVFFIHGGGFLMPNDKRQAYISIFAKVLTQQGYAVVSPDYPQFVDEEALEKAGGEKAGYEKAAQAVHLAYQFVREHAEELGIDRDKIAIIGGSAGGWAAFYTIANYEDHYCSFINCWGAPQVLPDLHSFPPVLSIHGTKDVLVPYLLELAAQKKMKEYGVKQRLITLDGCSHTPLNKFGDYIPEILRWLADGFAEKGEQ